MLTKNERAAIYIAAQKEGLEEFLSRVGLTETEFWSLVRGKYDPHLELRVREKWDEVIAVLAGRTYRRGDKR